MKELKNTRYQYILIIGNGFDLDLGLPTKYSDFLASKYFENLLNNENKLAEHLKNTNDLNKWIDIEEELKTYSEISKDSKIFLSDYRELCKSLLQYIESISYSQINYDSKAFRLIKRILEASNILLIDFNYTNTLKDIIDKQVDESEKELKNIEHIKIHGGISEGDIIFGVEDNARIKKEHIFLKKSASKIFKPLDFSFAIEKSDVVIFFGHSLGPTDHMYFSDFFTNAVIKRTNPRIGSEKQNIVLFHYGEDNYYSLLAEIDSLTHEKIKRLRQFNKFEMIDVKE